MTYEARRAELIEVATRLLSAALSRDNGHASHPIFTDADRQTQAARFVDLAEKLVEEAEGAALEGEI